MSIMFIHSQFSGAPNDGFLLNTLKALFRLSIHFLGYPYFIQWVKRNNELSIYPHAFYVPLQMQHSCSSTSLVNDVYLKFHNFQVS